MLAEFHWLRPAWLLLVPLIVVLAVLLARGRLGPGAWQAIVDRRLLPHVLARTAAGGSDLRWWLFGLTGIVAVVALAGPAWERVEQPVFREQQALVIALDLSRSMDAEDVAPSRLGRARLKIHDILERRRGGQTALLVYSANAFTVTPLTSDVDTIASLVNSVSTDIMPSRGSYPEIAIAKGQQLLDQADVGYGEVLLITDGGSSPAATEMAKKLRDAGYSLSVLGVGTSDGAPIPRRSGGFVTDNRGRIAVPRLEASGLEALAAAGGGRYRTLAADNGDLDALFSGAVRGSGRVASDESLATDRWREEGPWLVLLLLPLAALAFRRGWVLMLLVVVLPWPQAAQASAWDDLWETRDQQGRQALEAGDFERAAELFEDSEWQAVARYRGENYADSAAVFGSREDLRSRYNLGNALAMQGNLEAAANAYEQVLAAEPDHEDARYNLELVKDALQQQQEQQQAAGDDQQSTQNPGGEGEQSGEQGDQQQGSESQPSEGEDSEGDSGQREDGEMSEEEMQALQQELQRAAEDAQDGQAEQLSAAELAERRQQQEMQQAMEQWLRRVPDDPGALLRNKFRYQYRREGIDQDGNPVWPDNEVQPW